PAHTGLLLEMCIQNRTTVCIQNLSDWLAFFLDNDLYFLDSHFFGIVCVGENGPPEMGNYQFRAIRGLLVVTVIVLGLIVGLLFAFRVAVPVRTYGPWPFAIQNNPRSLAQMTAKMEFSAG